MSILDRVSKYHRKSPPKILCPRHDEVGRYCLRRDVATARLLLYKRRDKTANIIWSTSIYSATNANNVPTNNNTNPIKMPLPSLEVEERSSTMAAAIASSPKSQPPLQQCKPIILLLSFLIISILHYWVISSSILKITTVGCFLR